MSKETLVFVTGIVVFFSPFLGVPRDYKQALLIVCGILLMIIGYRLRRNAFLISLVSDGERKGDAFTENTKPQQTPTHRDSEVAV